MHAEGYRRGSLPRATLPELAEDETSRQDFAGGRELLIGFACRGGDIHMPSAYTNGEAIAILNQRQQQGLYVDSYMFIQILKQCSKTKDIVAARRAHDCIIQGGIDKHPYVRTTLLNLYIKCGRLQDAHQLFDGLEKTDRNVVTWTAMIVAYAKSGRGLEAYQLFLQMRREGFEPVAITYLSILNASASAGALEWVKEVHGPVRRAGLESDLWLSNALVHMYAKCSSIDERHCQRNPISEYIVKYMWISHGIHISSPMCRCGLV